MKTIEDRAHEILLKLIDVKELHKIKSKESAAIISQNVWDIAEAMQAEAEKRKDKSRTEVLENQCVDEFIDKCWHEYELKQKLGEIKFYTCLKCGAMRESKNEPY